MSTIAITELLPGDVFKLSTRHRRLFTFSSRTLVPMDANCPAFDKGKFIVQCVYPCRQMIMAPEWTVELVTRPTA